ncbi:MAG: hypothetical protein KDD62_03790 [Bdellovibrionales bacterium]|nr:hypothetical protein [Bdellovibrionales bacterium]
MVVRLLILVGLLWPGHAFAQVQDPFDPFALEPDSFEDFGNDADASKSSDELVIEAFQLQRDDRLLDARTKLLKALKKNPQDFKPYLALADYYQQHVGHFRLAMKYTLQGKKLFEQQYGPPPYYDLYPQQMHMDILNLLSQVRLNLDDYPGALEALQQLESFGYYSEWLPASKAWILMKLGRIEEAIKVARLGAMLGGNVGPTQNILGILLSMHGEREASLKVFEDAIDYELSLGTLGRPATPLNNMGEVLKELFEDASAKRAWVRAVRLPDGCEHVLPSLNLALLRITAADYRGAKRAIDNFESCVAQYPLRNGEEHKALVNLARGRIAMHTGHVDEALGNFEKARERQQWFGKIGTSQEDLLIGVLVSQAQALRFKSNELAHSVPETFTQRISFWGQRLRNSVQSWWLLRRARHIATVDLNELEDLHIRHTDSMLEYATLGTLLRGFPTSVLEARIEKELTTDKRSMASVYYQGYLGENLLAQGSNQQAVAVLSQARERSREDLDRLFRVHTGAQILKASTDRSLPLLSEVFEASIPAIRLYGLQLPINTRGLSDEFTELVNQTSFRIDNAHASPFVISYTLSNNQHELQFSATSSTVPSVQVRANSFEEALNKLNETVFRINLV